MLRRVLRQGPLFVDGGAATTSTTTRLVGGLAPPRDEQVFGQHSAEPPQTSMEKHATDTFDVAGQLPQTDNSGVFDSTIASAICNGVPWENAVIDPKAYTSSWSLDQFTLVSAKPDVKNQYASGYCWAFATATCHYHVRVAWP